MNTGNETQKEKDVSNQDTQIKSLSLIQTIKSVLWAMLGIQTKENLMRDFAHGKASNFIITGLLFVILFVLTLILAVNIVLSLAL
jgi:hypothetical protein|tara:strand:- start:4358 stop:4612 length:255 start_codon:yes stop_codon:yes gene_type:complete